MSTLGPEIRRYCRDVSSRLSNRFENIQSSIRLIGHTCVDRLNRIQNNASATTNSIINNDVEGSGANSEPNSANNDASTSVSPNISTNSSSECM